MCCLQGMKARTHLYQQDNIEATVFCTIPCDSEVPSKASDWLKAQYEVRRNNRAALACRCQTRATLRGWVLILGNSVIFGRKGSGLGCSCWCRWNKWLETLIEGVGSSRPKNWCLVKLFHSTPSVHIRSTSLCWD